jgi:nitric oxide dioxygenase
VVHTPGKPLALGEEPLPNREEEDRKKTMNPDQIQLVKKTFAAVAPIAPQAAALFYGRLFETAPELRALFKGDMAEQGRKLMSVLGAAVGSLERLQELVPVVQDLGRRHAGYGVKDEHYASVGAALLWTLEQGLGPAFTPAVKESWTVVYATLAGVMRDAARQAA